MRFPLSSLDIVDGLKETLEPRFLRITLSDGSGEFLTVGLRAVERLCKGEGVCMTVCVCVGVCVTVCGCVGVVVALGTVFNL